MTTESSLIEYPCDFPIKIMGRTEPGFAQAIVELVKRHAPEFVILQCGADSLAGDPITHLGLTEEAHGHAAARLCAIADRHASGRILAFGGGGYNRRNIARAWTRVVQAFVEAA